MRSLRSLSAFWLAIYLAGAAWAADTATPPASARKDSVTPWIALQRSGDQAAPPEPLPAEEAARAYRAFLETYDLRTPQFFFEERGGSSGK